MPDGNLVYYTKRNDVWVDKKNKQVVMQGKIAVREGNLEMFACPQGTKEHESIVATSSKAFPVFVALLALGAKPGHPSKYADGKLLPPAAPRSTCKCVGKMPPVNNTSRKARIGFAT